MKLRPLILVVAALLFGCSSQPQGPHQDGGVGQALNAPTPAVQDQNTQDARELPAPVSAGASPVSPSATSGAGGAVPSSGVQKSPQAVVAMVAPHQALTGTPGLPSYCSFTLGAAQNGCFTCAPRGIPATVCYTVAQTFDPAKNCAYDDTLRCDTNPNWQYIVKLADKQAGEIVYDKLPSILNFDVTLAAAYYPKETVFTKFTPKVIAMLLAHRDVFFKQIDTASFVADLDLLFQEETAETGGSYDPKDMDEVHAEFLKGLPELRLAVATPNFNLDAMLGFLYRFMNGFASGHYQLGSSLNSFRTGVCATPSLDLPAAVLALAPPPNSPLCER